MGIAKAPVRSVRAVHRHRAASFSRCSSRSARLRPVTNSMAMKNSPPSETWPTSKPRTMFGCSSVMAVRDENAHALSHPPRGGDLQRRQSPRLLLTRLVDSRHRPFAARLPADDSPRSCAPSGCRQQRRLRHRLHLQRHGPFRWQARPQAPPARTALHFARTRLTPIRQVVMPGT